MDQFSRCKIRFAPDLDRCIEPAQDRFGPGVAIVVDLPQYGIGPRAAAEKYFQPGLHAASLQG